MAGTISMAGLGSGMDVAGMVDALVNASSSQLNLMKTRAQENRAASTAISDVAGMLSKLKTAADALADPLRVQSFAASSTDTAITTSISGAASEGKFSVEVKDLALEYRAYSDPKASLSTALDSGGVMYIKIGDGEASAITLQATDTLSSIVSKINDAGLGVKATTVYDGTNYRMQLRGSATGAGNEVTITGVDLGLNGVENLKQQAQSAHLKIDGFDVYSKTNQVSGAIPGVTLTVSQKTTTPATVDVTPDASSLTTKLQSVVDNFNSVIKKVQSLAGYGTIKASNAQLAGDSTLRQLTMKMNRSISEAVDTKTSYTSMRSIGITLNKDGTLALDQSVLSKAVAANPEAVTKILSGVGTSGGIMDSVSDLTKSFTTGTDALLNTRRDTFDANAKLLDTRVNSEQDRLSRMRDTLNKQFSAMDSTVASSQSMMSYLKGTTSSG